MVLLVEMRDLKDVRPPRLVTVKVTKSGKRIEVAAALIVRWRIVTRRISEEERRFLADASGYNDPLLAFCATL